MTLLAPPHPMSAFNFKVDFYQIDDSGNPKSTKTELCSARFSEVSGIEATMEPKSIRAGGHNYGEIQRAGLVKFATVILKRGVTRAPDLWTWFELVGTGKTGIRLNAKLVQLWPDGVTPAMTWTMAHALPVKFKAATYVATSSEVGVEELHFVHEGLSLEMGETAPKPKKNGAAA